MPQLRFSALSKAISPLLLIPALWAGGSFLSAQSPAGQPPVLQASDKESEALVRRIDDHYNHLTSLHAHYSEHYSGMGMDRTEEGTLLLKKPGRMRWSYASPIGKVFILDGKFAWFYTPGDAQATRVPAKQLDDLRSPLRFLLGHTQLRKELDNLTVTPEGAGFHVAGVPRGLEQRVKRLSLWVASSGAINRMRLEEVDGAVTEFTFTEMQENVPVRDADFAFTPPAGVSIVEGLPPI